MIHGIRKSTHLEDCDGINGTLWGPLRYHQAAALGCGDMRMPNPGHDAVAHEADAYDAYRYFQEKGSDTPFNTLTQFVGLGHNNEAGKEEDEEQSAGKLWERALGAGGYVTLRRHWAAARARWEASSPETEGGRGRGKGEWEQPLLPLVAPLPGYARTAHARRAHAPPPSGTGTGAGPAGAGGARGWEPFTPDDCAEPGHVLPIKGNGE